MPLRNRIQKHNSSRTTIRKTRKHNRTSKKSGLRHHIYNPSKYTITQKHKILKLKPNKSLGGGEIPEYQKVLNGIANFLNECIMSRIGSIRNYINKRSVLESKIKSYKDSKKQSHFFWQNTKKSKNATDQSQVTALESFLTEIKSLLFLIQTVTKYVNSITNFNLDNLKNYIRNLIKTQSNGENKCKLESIYTKLIYYSDSCELCINKKEDYHASCKHFVDINAINCDSDDTNLLFDDIIKYIYAELPNTQTQTQSTNTSMPMSASPSSHSPSSSSHSPSSSSHSPSPSSHSPSSSSHSPSLNETDA